MLLLAKGLFHAKKKDYLCMSLQSIVMIVLMTDGERGNGEYFSNLGLPTHLWASYLNDSSTINSTRLPGLVFFSQATK